MWPRTAHVIRTAGFAAAAILLSAIAYSLVHLAWVPAPIAIGLLCLAPLAAVRPGIALLVVAAFVPVASYLLRRWNPGVAWAETLVITFAAGWYARRLLVRRADPLAPSAVRPPLVVFACVVLASTIVQMSVDHARVGTAEFSRAMLRYFSRDFFVSGSDRYLHAAAFLLEGLVLFSISARVTAADGRQATRLAGVLAASTAVAAAINLQQLIASAHRFDNFWALLVQHVATARLNTHYPDVNAAGSTFAMLLFVSGGLAAAARPAARLWGIAAAFIGIGLWISGSRAALVACPIALACLAVAAARPRMSSHGRLLTNVFAVVFLAAALAVVYAPTRGNQKAASVAARVRLELARTTLHMVAEEPLFGIGLGEFYQRSGEFSSAELLTLFPPAYHENAHNNFLQIFAETGIVGLAAFGWLLITVLYVAVRPLAGGRGDTLGWGCVAGLFAFLLTCFAGHPLLTREAGYAFWVVLGLAAGHASRQERLPQTDSHAARWRGSAARFAVACLVLSVPLRIVTARAHGDFEHLGIGLSPQWETADQGVRYRSAVTRASIFVPGDTGFHFKVRALSDASERLELKLGGRVADVVLLVPGQWTDVAMPARTAHADTRFTRMDLTVLDADKRPVTIWISKVEQLVR